MGRGSTFSSTKAKFWGCPKSIQFIGVFLNLCGHDKIFMKIPNYLILRIELKFNKKKLGAYVVCQCTVLDCINE